MQIIQLVHGASETHASVKSLWDGYDYDCVRKLCKNAHVVAPVDMKMANKMVGIKADCASYASA